MRLTFTLILLSALFSTACGNDECEGPEDCGDGECRSTEEGNRCTEVLPPFGLSGISLKMAGDSEGFDLSEGDTYYHVSTDVAADRTFSEIEYLGSNVSEANCETDLVLGVRIEAGTYSVTCENPADDAVTESFNFNIVVIDQGTPTWDLEAVTVIDAAPLALTLIKTKLHSQVKAQTPIERERTAKN